MTIDPLTGLPAAVVTGTVSSVVSLLVAALSPLLLQVPGFRANDQSRNTLMPMLVYLLTLGGIVGLAWCLGITLPRDMWPNLLIYAAGGTGFAHVAYKTVRASGAAQVGPAPVTPAQPVPAGGYPSDGVVTQLPA